ncbi:tail sheath protein [Vibrio phage 1.121.O._10N.286.46.C4]|nr:tail sheath protein [Vibrio phage 1.121.O._10N.286.46.C4]
MPFNPTVGVTIRQATTTGSISSLNHTMVLDVNAYHQAVITPYYSIEDLNGDVAVPKDSTAYAALQMGLSNASVRSLPIYLGRVEAATTVLTPEVADSTVYSFDLTTIDTTTGSVAVTGSISFTSDADATAAEIVTGIETAVTSANFDTNEVTLADGATLTITPAANRQVVISNLVELTATFTTTKSGAEAFSDIQDVDNEDWYYVCTTSRDNTFRTELCQAVEATESSDFPKIFATSDAAPETIVAQTDPSDTDDYLGVMEDAGYGNCFGQWHDQANTIFPEVGVCTYTGGFFAGTKGLKYSANAKIPDARHPVLGRTLTKAEIGFILDRNAIVRSKEMGVSIFHVGKAGTASKGQGAWIDNLTISHWIRLTMKLRIFNGLVNADNGGLPITFTRGDRLKIKDIGDGVLNEAVQRKMLSGHTGIFVPENVSFEDQATRTLKDLTFTGYFAGKVNFVLIDGILTYTGEV